MSDTLANTLAKLHEQLQMLGDIDEQDRQMLSEAVAEIQDSLKREEIDSANLARNFHKTTQRFSQSHPRLTQFAGQVADALAAMGI